VRVNREKVVPKVGDECEDVESTRRETEFFEKTCERVNFLKREQVQFHLLQPRVCQILNDGSVSGKGRGLVDKVAKQEGDHHLVVQREGEEVLEPTQAPNT